MRRTRRQCNRQQSRASHKMRRSSRLAHEAPDMQARRTTTRALPRIFRLIWIPPTPKKTYLNPCNQKRKILAKLSNPKKSRNRKFQTPQTEFLRSGPVTWNPKYYPFPPTPRPPARLVARSLSVWDGKAFFNAEPVSRALKPTKARRFPMFCCPRFLCILVKIF